MPALALLAALALACTAAALPPDPTQTEFIRLMESRRHQPAGSLDADSAHSYDMISLSLDYRVEPLGQPLTGWAAIRLVARENLLVIPLNAQGMTILGVNVFDQALPFTHVHDTLYVNYAMQIGDSVTLDIHLSVPSEAEPGGIGFHSEADHAYTFSEPYGARRWMPCFDQPFDKFNEVTIAVNMPASWWLASNGALIQTTYPSAGRKREVYYHDDPISTYLVMLAAGNYARRVETVGDVLYRYFAFPQDSAAAAYDWQRTPLMTAVYESLFGDYPFGQYGMVQTDIMGGRGAMEHQTFTTYGQHLVDSLRTYEGVVAHELAHMWFGDAVTCVDFRNVWLNEGFATYASALFYEATEGQAVLDDIMWNMSLPYLNATDLHGVAIYDPPPNLMFSAIEYEKAAWVLHMLREQLLGDSLFFAAMRSYFSEFSGGWANTEDFIAVVNQTAGQDLRWFFNQWIYQPGHPVVHAVIEPGVPTSHDVTVTVTQQQTAGPVFRFPLSVDVRTTEGVMHSLFWVDQAQQSVVHGFPSAVHSADWSAYQLTLVEFSSQGAADAPTVPQDFVLGPVYPNPFNATARIPFVLNNAGRAVLRVYDINGRLVKTLADASFAPGRHEVEFSAEPTLSSGLYLVTLESGAQRRIAKALLVK
ncbi:MAG: M1 family aminopeptidase [bacterium]|nr:M1 family aminopeptidase [bacterium]